MRKIVLVAAAAAGALTLAACSEGTEDAAEATVEEGMADAEANMEAAGDTMSEGAAEVEAGADAMAADADAAAAEVEADVQDETTAEAQAD